MKRSIEPRHDAVNHDRAMLLAVRAGVLELEALGQLHIELNGAALPGTADGVCQMEVELRAVERAVALVDNVVLADLGDGLGEGLLQRTASPSASPMWSSGMVDSSI